MKTNARPLTDGESRDGTGIELTRCPHCGVYAYHDDHYCACCGGNLIVWQPRDRHPVAFYCTQCGERIDQGGGRRDEG